MRKLPQILAVATLLVATTVFGQAARTTLDFNADWRFMKGDVPEAATAAFNDGEWRKLNVPHDWSIEGPYEAPPARGGRGAPPATAEGAPARGPVARGTGGGGGWLPAGIGWYRKSFTLPPNSADKRVFIEFDGVMSDSTVFLNGQQLGRRPNGYMSFRYELTDKLNANGSNILAVRADNALQPASRWYAGAGINRNVRLIVTDPIRLEQWATFITTPKVSAESATIKVDTSIINQSDAAKNIALQVDIVDPAGKIVQTLNLPAKSIAPGKAEAFSGEVTLPTPQLWGVDSPTLYKAVARVKSDNAVLDDETTSFGIRHFEFKGDTGFWLNGKNMKIYGACLHHDAGGVGAAVPMGVWERRLDQLRSLGVNGIRTAHNAPDPAFLALCDRKGFLVMHELFDSWMTGKNPGDYGRFFNEWAKIDVTDAIKRDRNHPSVILYSTGNEIRDIPNTEVALTVLKNMRETYKQFDPTRPITHALFRPAESNAYTNGIADLLDVVGTNYRPAELLAHNRNKPNVPIIETETNYGLTELSALRDNPQLAGLFMWTGVDYLGEVIGGYPINSQGFGMIDRINDIRAVGYERQAWWTTKPFVKISRNQPHPPPVGGNSGGGRVLDWTPANVGQPQTIQVYSNAQTVELFLNDKSLGSKTWDAPGPRTWNTPFEAGTLRAVAKNGGTEVATETLRTAGAATKLQLTVDQPALTTNWDDVAYVRVRITDDQGTTNPTRFDPVTFSITGPGYIMALDNASLNSVESYRGNNRSAFMGTLVAVIKASGTTGPITVKATSPGLAESSVIIQTKQ